MNATPVTFVISVYGICISLVSKAKALGEGGKKKGRGMLTHTSSLTKTLKKGSGGRESNLLFHNHLHHIQLQQPGKKR